MTDLLTEFTSLEPESVHLVGTPANGFPAPLLAKAAESLDEELLKEFVDGLCGVTGCDACHDRYLAVRDTPDFVEKARLRAKQRHALSDGQFAFPKQRKEPLNDAAHVRNAMSRFSQVEGVSESDRRAAARRIIARAHELGIEVSEDSDVARAAKQIAPDRSVPESEAESQTHESEPDPQGPEPSPEAQDGGEPRHESAGGEPDRTSGQGDTAPDTALPEGEAESQTHDDVEGIHKAGEGDGTGDAAPGGQAEARDAEREGESQTEDDAEGNAHKASAENTPGSDAWEHKDVALGLLAERLTAQLAEVVHTFTEREKAEGGAAKQKAWRDVIHGIHLVADRPELIKEMADMPADELVKALDELGKARRQAEKAARKASKEHDAAKAARKAAKAAEAPKSDALAKALDRVEAAEKAAAEARELAEKLAAEDGARVIVNPAGATAILRGPEGSSVLKQMDDRVAKAQEQVASASTDLQKMRAEQELRAALQQRATAKLVAADNARSRGQLSPSRFGPNTAQLFENTSSIGDDTGIRGFNGSTASRR